MRARKKAWADRELSENELLIENPEAYKGVWSKYFASGEAVQSLRPLHVELGCGKGRFIVESARLNPEVNFLAVERERQVIITGMRRAREEGLSNIGFIIADVTEIPAFFGPGEIKRLYINFCDPWPNRKKWAKRRLTHVNFLNMYKPLLDGELHFKTDNRELFEFSLGQFSQHGWQLNNICWDLHNTGLESNIMTEYEEKFSQRGMAIMRCEARYANIGQEDEKQDNAGPV